MLSRNYVIITGVLFLMVGVGCVSTPESRKAFEDIKERKIESNKSEADKWERLGNEEMAKYYDNECLKEARTRETIWGLLLEVFLPLPDMGKYRCNRDGLSYRMSH